MHFLIVIYYYFPTKVYLFATSRMRLQVYEDQKYKHCLSLKSKKEE